MLPAKIHRAPAFALTVADIIDQLDNPSRHLRTLVSVALEAGRGKRLVTLTAQSAESKHPELSQVYKSVIDSYKPS